MNTFSSLYTLLNDYMITCLIRLEFIDKERHENWSTNFVVRDTSKKILKSSERATKISVESTEESLKWYYMIVCEAHELHDEEEAKARLMRLIDEMNFASTQSVCEQLCVIQNDKILTFNSNEIIKEYSVKKNLSVSKSRKSIEAIKDKNKKNKKRSIEKNSSISVLKTIIIQDERSRNKMREMTKTEIDLTANWYFYHHNRNIREIEFDNELSVSSIEFQKYVNIEKSSARKQNKWRIVKKNEWQFNQLFRTDKSHKSWNYLNRHDLRNYQILSTLYDHLRKQWRKERIAYTRSTDLRI